jgi:hypothetical protein
MYTVFVLSPDYRYITCFDCFDKAKALAQDLVQKGYQRAEVWDEIIPLWTAWRDRRGYIRSTDDRDALYA